MDPQRTLDYANDAQKRVSVDTGILEETANVTVPAGTGGVLLPAVVAQVYSVQQGTEQLHRMSAGNYLRMRSGSVSVPCQIVFSVVGRTLYLLPSPSVATILTLTYTRRAADTSSDVSLELTGEYARAVEMLAGAYALLDDGQPELAAQALADYDADIQRLRLRAQRRGTSIGTTEVRVGGW